MTTLPISYTQPPADGERTITTQDIASLLGKQHKDVMSAANTLIKQRKNFSFYEYTFSHAVNRNPVLAYQMPYGSAMMLIARLDIDYVPKFLDAATKQAQPVDAIHHDLMFKISIPERWVVEVIGRKAASVHRSLSTATSRAKGGELEKHWEYRNGERWYTPWFLANAPSAKEDGMVFKNALTGLAVTLGLEGDVKKFLLAP